MLKLHQHRGIKNAFRLLSFQDSAMSGVCDAQTIQILLVDHFDELCTQSSQQSL
jgi:hypothetical protein